MFDRLTALQIIDQAFDERRFCEFCGAPTVLRNDGDRVVLECSEIGGPGILARIGEILMPHTRRVVIDLSEGIAA